MKQWQGQMSDMLEGQAEGTGIDQGSCSQYWPILAILQVVETGAIRETEIYKKYQCHVVPFGSLFFFSTQHF